MDVLGFWAFVEGRDRSLFRSLLDSVHQARLIVRYGRRFSD